MIKWIMILHCCFYVSGNLVAQTRRNGRDMKLQSVVTEQAEIKNGAQEPGRQTVVEYDRRGNVITNIERNADSTYRNYDTYVFNKQNREIEHTEYDNTGKIIRKTASEYDNLGNKTTELITDSAGILIEKVVFHYNGFDQKTEETTYKATGELKKKILYAYDKQGSLIERSSYDANGVLTYSKKYVYQYYK